MDYYVGGGYQKDINLYFEQACASVRQELIEQKIISEEAKIRGENLLSNADVGDRVFCIPECDDVILLEKNGDFSKRCRCSTMDGEEFFVFPHYLNPISKGFKFAIYKSGVANKMLEFEARELGFRVEIEVTNRGVIYTFYGDSQQQVDDFVGKLKELKIKKN